jgi:mannose-1-phosphate guanylyltransferase
MRGRNGPPTDPWVIILAGGEGTRMCQFAEFCFGQARPKQYCTFCGGRSLLEQTIRLAESLTPPERIVTVIGSDHWRFLSEHPPGRVLAQPQPRGTAVGVFWPLSMLVGKHDHDVALILPSDHFLHPPERASNALADVCDLVQRRPNRVVLVGAEADIPETEYGWIEHQRSSDSVELSRQVLNFHEKPSAKEASLWMRSGQLWNTMITGASIGTLWRLAKQVLPEVSEPMEHPVFGSRGAWPTEPTQGVVEDLYAELPGRDFSRDFLTHVTEDSVVVPLRGVLWSDWGRPERVQESLRRLEQSFPESRENQECSNLRQTLDAWNHAQPTRPRPEKMG